MRADEAGLTKGWNTVEAPKRLTLVIKVELVLMGSLWFLHHPALTFPVASFQRAISWPFQMEGQDPQVALAMTQHCSPRDRL